MTEHFKPLIALAPKCAVAALCLILCNCTQRDSALRLVRGGGKGPPTIVLLHGLGSTPERWRVFESTIGLPGAKDAPLFLFPEGPERTSPPSGPPDGRAWWNLDLASYTAGPGTLLDMSRAGPPALASAAANVRLLLKGIAPRWYRRGNPVVFGGFSQGAMVAMETAFTTDAPMAALVVLSGTPVNEAEWVREMQARRGLPVFMAHGRDDRVLPFSGAEHLMKEMKAAGLDVTWYPFEGGHEIPKDVVDSLNGFLSRVLVVRRPLTSSSPTASIHASRLLQIQPVPTVAPRGILFAR